MNRVWYGFPKWQSYYTTHFDLEKWQAWQEPESATRRLPSACGCPTGLSCDPDVDDAEVADQIEILCFLTLGPPIAVRVREGSSRRLLIYVHNQRSMPVNKGAMAFTLPRTGDKRHLVEVLGEGQQAVIEGPHAKGAMQSWRDGKGLVNFTVGPIKPILIERKHVFEFFSKLKEMIDEEGGTIEGEFRRRERDRGQAYDIKSPGSDLRANDLGLLKRAIEAIDINDERLAGYDQWLALYVAICAACGGAMDFYQETVLPWLLRHPNNGEEAMEAKWRSFYKSELGADHVYRWAAKFGFTEGLPKEELSDEELAGLFGAPDAGEGKGGTASGASALDGTVAGGFPPASSCRPSCPRPQRRCPPRILLHRKARASTSASSSKPGMGHAAERSLGAGICRVRAGSF